VNPVIVFFQQNAATFGVIAALVSVLGVAFGLYKAAHNRHVQGLKDQIHHLEHQLADYKAGDPEGLKQLNDRLSEQLDAATSALDILEGKCAALEDRAATERQKHAEETARLRQTGDTLTGELESAKEELARRDRAERSRANLMKKAMRLEGRVWERKLLQGAPKFRPLHERHVAVISVLNLKGGVGKTTTTAHLAAALSAKGYKPLLIDLDLQGSLSSLFVNESALKDRSKEKLLLQHFLTAAAEGHMANLLDHCVPVLDGKAGVVPTSDGMVYSELNLTMRWLLRLGRKDTRFLLRRALHQKRVTRRYGIVLLDCPPLFNTCCVNALAASDYVIIPVTPSNKAAERVPLLLDRLKGLCRVINPELQVAGLLLNRTRQKGNLLTEWETRLWEDLQGKCQDQWKLPVHAFETYIRDVTPEVRDAEQEFSPPAPGSELYTMFSKLAAELEERLPRDCRRTASTPLGLG
jgi:chromosome partitioning protein